LRDADSKQTLVEKVGLNFGQSSLAISIESPYSSLVSASQMSTPPFLTWSSDEQVAEHVQTKVLTHFSICVRGKQEVESILKQLLPAMSLIQS